MDFRVSGKQVVQGSFGHFKESFLINRATVYFVGPEPLPLAFFDDERGRVTRLFRVDSDDLDLALCFCGFLACFGQRCGELDLFRLCGRF